MSLPARLQPWWPVLKRGHRFLTLIAGILFRRLARFFGERGVPVVSAPSSEAAAASEPNAVIRHLGGTSATVEREMPSGFPPHHWAFARGLTATVADRYVLEIRNGRLVGDIGAVLTPRGVLDFESSPYFGIAGWREHPVYLHPRLPVEVRHSGTVLGLATRGATTNYYHFLYDVVGRYAIAREVFPDLRPDVVVVPHATRYQQQLLELVGVAGRLVQPRADRTVRAERLLVPSSPNHALDAPPWIVDWLRAHLPARSGEVTPRRLYLTRGERPNSRRYVEEAELWPRLEKRGFVRLDPGLLSVQEQIDAFHGAEVIVAPHGAALTNITFCQAGAKVLELFAPSYVHLGLWAIAAAVGDIDYRYLVGRGAVPRDGAVLAGVLDDVSIAPEVVEAALDELIGA